jgi:cation:H+ antiporter
MNPEMLTILQGLMLLASLLILVKSSDVVSNAATEISRITGLGDMAVGFLLLSVVTSLPELGVSIFAVSSGDVGVSVGTLFGSNVANIGLVLGLTAIFSPSILRIKGETWRNLLVMMLVSSAVPILVLIAAGLTRFVGFTLLAIFGWFCFYYIRSAARVEAEHSKKPKGLLREVLVVVGGVAVVLVSAQFVVSSSVSISRFFGIEEAVIGATVIAVGTSLPELSVSVTAARKNHMDLALGNILGSCVTNLTLILGAVLALSAATINIAVFAQLVLMLLLVNLSVWRMLMDNKIGLRDGLVLGLLYMVFLASSAGVQIAILSPEYLLSTLKIVWHFLSLAVVYGIVAAVAVFLAATLNKG